MHRLTETLVALISVEVNIQDKYCTMRPWYLETWAVVTECSEVTTKGQRVSKCHRYRQSKCLIFTYLDYSCLFLP